jgi:hypothetical protein
MSELQALPIGSCCTHEPIAQYAPKMQSLSWRQDVWQVFPEQVREPGQFAPEVVAPVHPPVVAPVQWVSVALAELHWPWLLALFAQAVLAQTVVAAAGAHAPLPSQPAAQRTTAQVPCGSCPFGTFVQVPGLLLKLHALQPLHATLQQTPSAQTPLAHSPDCEQLPPFDFSARSGGPKSIPARSPVTERSRPARS